MLIFLHHLTLWSEHRAWNSTSSQFCKACSLTALPSQWIFFCSSSLFPLGVSQDPVLTLYLSHSTPLHPAELARQPHPRHYQLPPKKNKLILPVSRQSVSRASVPYVQLRVPNVSTCFIADPGCWTSGVLQPRGLGSLMSCRACCMPCAGDEWALTPQLRGGGKPIMPSKHTSLDQRALFCW